MDNIQELHLISAIPPSVNHYLSYRAIVKNGKPMAMSYKTPEAVRYQKAFTKYAQQEANRQGWVKSENKFQHYYMDCDFYFPRIDMDANNYFKCPADAITAAENIWIDDSQLCERVRSIRYSSDNPRIELTIKAVDYIGIFDNMSQLEEFRSNCIQCQRYKDGKCSIFQKTLEGRMQSEIKDMACDKFKKIKVGK